MTKVSDLPLYLQEFTKAADRNHYYCWRVVYKEDSPDKLTVAKAEFSALEKAGIICHSTSLGPLLSTWSRSRREVCGPVGITDD